MEKKEDGMGLYHECTILLPLFPESWTVGECHHACFNSQHIYSLPKHMTIFKTKPSHTCSSMNHTRCRLLVAVTYRYYIFSNQSLDIFTTSQNLHLGSSLNQQPNASQGCIYYRSLVNQQLPLGSRGLQI